MPTASSRSAVSVRMAAVTVRAATRAISPSGAEVPALAGERQQIFVRARDAVDVREAVLEHPARQELVGHLRHDGRAPGPRSAEHAPDARADRLPSDARRAVSTPRPWVVGLTMRAADGRRDRIDYLSEICYDALGPLSQSLTDCERLRVRQLTCGCGSSGAPHSRAAAAFELSANADGAWQNHARTRPRSIRNQTAPRTQAPARQNFEKLPNS